MAMSKLEYIEERNTSDEGNSLSLSQFSWQKGDSGTPPRKSILPMALNRLFKRRLQDAFYQTQCLAQQVESQFRQLKDQGEQVYAKQINEEELNLKKLRQKMRQIFMWMEVRQGHESLLSAFEVWKQDTFLEKQAKQKRINEQKIAEESLKMSTISSQLTSEIEDLERQLKFDRKEQQRNQLWLDTKIAKLSLDSNGKLNVHLICRCSGVYNLALIQSFSDLQIARTGIKRLSCV